MSNNHITPPGEHVRVLAAVSGGGDSMALLYMLHELKQAGRIELCAAHFEHGIRGEASLHDAEFVTRVCDELHVPLTVGRGSVPALATEQGIGVEQAARQARYIFLRREKARLGADYIALAHHMDDQAETVLMHLLRGSGLQGAGGMSEFSGDLWRPLLRWRKAELIDYLKSIGADWREDETNQTPDNPRNILRLRAWPALEAAYPGSASALCRFADIARTENDYMAAQTEAHMGQFAQQLPCGWRLKHDESLHPALLRRCVRLMTGLDAQACMAVEQLWQQGTGQLGLPGGVRCELTGGWLYVISQSATQEIVDLPPQGTIALGIGKIAVSSAPAVPSRDPFCQVLDAASLTGACLRTRRVGDYIQPLGMSGSKSLSDYFTDRKVPRPLRDYVMLIARGSEVLWAVGVGISHQARLRQGSRGLMLKATLNHQEEKAYAAVQ